jgi:hypothetical protein
MGSKAARIDFLRQVVQQYRAAKKRYADEYDSRDPEKAPTAKDIEREVVARTQLGKQERELIQAAAEFVDGLEKPC